MSIRNAINLLNAVEFEESLRIKMYMCQTNKELEEYLKSQGYEFNHDEFEDAVNHLHVQCQTLERAQLLLQKAEWLRYVLFTSAKIAI